MAIAYGVRMTTREFLGLLKLDFEHIEAHGSATTGKFFDRLDEIAR